MDTTALSTAFSIDFAPIIAIDSVFALCCLIGILGIMSLFLYRRGIIWRALTSLFFLLIFLNPSFVEEERSPVKDVAAVVVDRSPSQSFGDRAAVTEEALNQIQGALSASEHIDLRVIEAPIENSQTARETNLFSALDQALSDVSRGRRAGVIVLTDGQVHDVPTQQLQQEDYGPVHTLLTGEKDERDRQLKILEAPAYGIVDQQVNIRFRIEDTNKNDRTFVRVTIKQNDLPPIIRNVPVNEDLETEITIEHAGQNIVDFEIETVDGEITAANNRVPMIINGVRDRLKVLLVSGQPHSGGRTWRNLLTADPGVDLVHFTILREPNKLDATPQRELSLIAFPFRELFEVKLYDFDLIIFDRYRLNRILPQYYFTNIARYVREGGALLEASGPSFAGQNSIYTTALEEILPAYPTTEVYEQSYKPHLTDKGLRHPVTQDLPHANRAIGETPQWGPWLRQVGIVRTSGYTLMQGIDDMPLLILDRVGKGRIAHLATDQIWLWSRGYEGGGPQADLLRRLAHWLMKEPELEENALLVSAESDTLFIRRRSLETNDISVTVTDPEGNETQKTLTATDSGYLEGRIKADKLGVYSVSDGEQKRFAVIGALNPPELQGVVTTEDKLAPIAETSGGGIFWLTDGGVPTIRAANPGRQYHGASWLGLKKNNSYTVTGVKEIPVLSNTYSALLLMLLVLAAWWLESRLPKKQRD